MAPITFPRRSGMILGMIRHALAPVVPAAAATLDLPRTLAPGTRGVALTFDDGPHPEGTPAVLEALSRAGALATFFVIGEQVQRRPELVAEIAAAGHVVALHGYHHRLQLRLERRCGQNRRLARGMAAIEPRPAPVEDAGTVRHMGSTALRVCGPRARQDCGRCCGRGGARTGASSRRLRGLRRGRRGGSAPAR